MYFTPIRFSLASGRVEWNVFDCDQKNKNCEYIGDVFRRAFSTIKIFAVQLYKSFITILKVNYFSGSILSYLLTTNVLTLFLSNFSMHRVKSFVTLKAHSLIIE